MSAEILRRAASLMRERAEAATAGPWDACQDSHAEIHVCEEGRGLFGVVSNPATGREDYGRSNAEHIASWHPVVALAVADWLDGSAKTNCFRWDNADVKTKAATGCIAHSEALAVARAYLGDPA